MADQLPPPRIPVSAAKIRQRRQLLGLDVPTLAGKVRISASYMRSIDNGNRRNVSPPVFVRLCGALRLRVDQRHTLLRDPEVDTADLSEQAVA